MWTFVDLKINKRVDALIKLKNKRVDKKLWMSKNKANKLLVLRL